MTNATLSVDVSNTHIDDEALPRRDVGEVGHPQRVWTWWLELPVDVIARTGRGLIWDRGADPFATDRPL